jgi:pimeloyl-ACP methyl ester carboxylesterase
VLLAAGGKFPPAPEVVKTLAIYLDPSQPEDQRIKAAKAALFGPQSNPSREDLLLDCLSPGTSTAQGIAARDPGTPLDSWWPGGRAPMLVIQGLSDVFATPENGRSLKTDYPARVTLVEIDGLGHEMTREKPDVIAAEIAKFVRQLPP